MRAGATVVGPGLTEDALPVAGDVVGSGITDELAMSGTDDAVIPMDAGVGPGAIATPPTGAPTLTATIVVAAPTTETGPVGVVVLLSTAGNVGAPPSVTPVTGGDPTPIWARVAFAANAVPPSEATPNNTATTVGHLIRRIGQAGRNAGLAIDPSAQLLEARLDAEQTQ